MFSDIPWEKFGIMERFPNIQFYDYTKNFVRAMDHAKGRLPGNYHLTFSRSEENEARCLNVLDAGGNVAVVFGIKSPNSKQVAKAEREPDYAEQFKLPTEWMGYKVIDGDKTDLRFLDPKTRPGVVVGLRTKGNAFKDDTSGFIVRKFGKTGDAKTDPTNIKKNIKKY